MEIKDRLFPLFSHKEYFSNFQTWCFMNTYLYLGTLKNVASLSEMMTQLSTDDNGVWIWPSVCTCLVGKQKL